MKLTKKALTTCVFFFAACLAAAPAFADLIQGQVTATDRQNESVTISPRDPIGDLPPQINLKANASDLREHHGISSIDELAVGDEILVEADKPALGGNWKAKTILKADQIAARGRMMGEPLAPGEKQTLSGTKPVAAMPGQGVQNFEGGGPKSIESQAGQTLAGEAGGTRERARKTV